MWTLPTLVSSVFRGPALRPTFSLDLPDLEAHLTPILQMRQTAGTANGYSAAMLKPVTEPGAEAQLPSVSRPQAHGSQDNMALKRSTGSGPAGPTRRGGRCSGCS